MRLDANGGFLWNRVVGNLREQAGTAVSADPSGNVFVAGWAIGALPFADSAFANTDYKDGFLVKLER